MLLLSVLDIKQQLLSLFFGVNHSCKNLSGTLPFSFHKLKRFGYFWLNLSPKSCSKFIHTYDEVLLRATNQLPGRVNWNGDDDDSVNIRIREAYNTCLTKLFSGLGWPAERINQQLTLKL